MNLALAEVGGEILVVSQFTLLRRRPQGTQALVGRRRAARHRGRARARRSLGRSRLGAAPCARGAFREHMEVELVNDGPVTLWIDSASL